MPLNIPSDVGPLHYDFAGNLGVGKENPAVKLDIAGSAAVSENLSVSGTATMGDVEIAGGLARAGMVIAPRCIHTGGVTATQTSDGNDTAPSATETYIAEVFIPCNMTVTGIAFFNGSAVGTDKLIGFLCNAAGTVIATTALAGTTASGTDAFQKIPLTAAYDVIGPGTYYVALQCNGTTYRFNSHILGTFGASKKTSTVFGTLASVTPPTTFTTALGPIASLY